MMTTTIGSTPKRNDASSMTDVVPPQDLSIEPEPPATDEAIATKRAAIDTIDACVIALIEQRRSLSSQIQQLRLENGGTRLSVGRELEIVQRYRLPLGRSGSDLARIILTLSRGSAPDAPPVGKS